MEIFSPTEQSVFSKIGNQQPCEKRLGTEDIGLLTKTSSLNKRFDRGHI